MDRQRTSKKSDGILAVMEPVLLAQCAWMEPLEEKLKQTEAGSRTTKTTRGTLKRKMAKPNQSETFRKRASFWVEQM
uniref:Uncharacterized protein n=1 Tax=Caenorhabditis japonica TaxID=281687 RepID=A0A8R1IVS2_CAEJA